MPYEPQSRRSVLKGAGLAAATSLSGCIGIDRPIGSRDNRENKTQSPQNTDIPESWDVDPLEHDKLIGSHYYPWYDGTPDDWNSVGTPVIGNSKNGYNSRNKEVINQHIKWAVEHGINWFSMSWWEHTDDVIKDHFLEADPIDDVKFSMLYEVNGWFDLTEDKLIDFDSKTNRQILQENLQHLENTYFNHPSHLQIDGRPPLFVFRTDSFRGNVAEAWSEAKNSIDSDPYLIADNLGGGAKQLFQDYMEEFDAATIYNPYTPEALAENNFQHFKEYLVEKNEKWLLATKYTDVDFIPVVLPRYNDTPVPNRDGTVLERSSEGFQQLCQEVRDTMDQELNAVLVTSFNEWPEYTAVEPGERYGQTYLDIIEKELAKGTPDYISDEYNLFELDFSKTFKPARYREDTDDYRDLAFMLGDMRILDENEEVLSHYDIGVPEAEPVFVRGAYHPEQHPNTSLKEWRWLGGPAKRSVIYVNKQSKKSDKAVIHGSPIPEGEGRLTADIYWNREQTDQILFDESENYTLSLSTI